MKNQEYINTMSNAVKKNIKYLNFIVRFTKPETKPIAHELIKLYADRKVSHVTTIINVLEMLSSNNKRGREKHQICDLKRFTGWFKLFTLETVCSYLT